MRLLIAAMLCAACGGTPEPFPGDRILAELRSGAPYCAQASTGPTITTRTAVVPFGNTTYTQQITRCDWTCCDTGVYQRAACAAEFHTDEAGRWVRNFYVDPDPAHAACPTG